MIPFLMNKKNHSVDVWRASLQRQINELSDISKYQLVTNTKLGKNQVESYRKKLYHLLVLVLLEISSINQTQAIKLLNMVENQKWPKKKIFKKIKLEDYDLFVTDIESNLVCSNILPYKLYQKLGIIMILYMIKHMDKIIETYDDRRGSIRSKIVTEINAIQKMVSITHNIHIHLNNAFPVPTKYNSFTINPDDINEFLLLLVNSVDKKLRVRGIDDMSPAEIFPSLNYVDDLEVIMKEVAFSAYRIMTLDFKRKPNTIIPFDKLTGIGTSKKDNDKLVWYIGKNICEYYKKHKIPEFAKILSIVSSDFNSSYYFGGVVKNRKESKKQYMTGFNAIVCMKFFCGRFYKNIQKGISEFEIHVDITDSPNDSGKLRAQELKAYTIHKNLKDSYQNALRR